MKLIYQLLFIKTTPGKLRLFLALLVVVYHTVKFLPIGSFAVYVFFILSGYWISRMYTEKYCKLSNPYLTFIKSRIYRLIPVYFLILVLSIIVYLYIPELRIKLISSIKDETNFLFNFSCLGLNFSNFRIIGPAWSLDIEIQYYLIAPILLIFSNLWENFTNLFLAITVILSIIVLCMNQYFPITIITFLPFFVIGMSIYKTKFNPTNKTSLQFLILALIVFIFSYISPAMRHNLLDHSELVSRYSYSELMNIVLALLTVPYIANNVNQKYSSNMNNDSLYASMSFIIYLLHWPLLKVYVHLTEDLNSMILKLFTLILYYILCIVLSIFLSKYFDPYFDNIRKIWLSKLPISNIAATVK